jgi:hypothetical protein
LCQAGVGVPRIAGIIGMHRVHVVVTKPLCLVARCCQQTGRVNCCCGLPLLLLLLLQGLHPQGAVCQQVPGHLLVTNGGELERQVSHVLNRGHHSCVLRL